MGSRFRSACALLLIFCMTVPAEAFANPSSDTAASTKNTRTFDSNVSLVKGILTIHVGNEPIDQVATLDLFEKDILAKLQAFDPEDLAEATRMVVIVAGKTWTFAGPGDPIWDQVAKAIGQVASGIKKGSAAALESTELSAWAVMSFMAGFLLGGPAGIAANTAKILKALSTTSLAFLAVAAADALASGDYELFGYYLGQAAIFYLASKGGVAFGKQYRNLKFGSPGVATAVIPPSQKADAKTPPPPAKTVPRPRTPPADRRAAARVGQGKVSNKKPPVRRNVPGEKKGRQATEMTEEDFFGEDGGVLTAAPPKPIPGNTTSTSPGVRSRTRQTAPAPRSAPIVVAPAPIPMAPVNALPMKPITGMVALPSRAQKPTLPVQVPSTYVAIGQSTTERNHEIATYKLWEHFEQALVAQGNSLGFAIPLILVKDGKTFQAPVEFDDIETSDIPSNVILFDWLIGFTHRSVDQENVGRNASSKSVLVKGHAAAFENISADQWLLQTQRQNYSAPITWEKAKSYLPQNAFYQTMKQKNLDQVSAVVAPYLTPLELANFRYRWLDIISLRPPAASRDASQLEKSPVFAKAPKESALSSNKAKPTVFTVSIPAQDRALTESWAAPFRRDNVKKTTIHDLTEEEYTQLNEQIEQYMQKHHKTMDYSDCVQQILGGASFSAQCTSVANNIHKKCTSGKKDEYPGEVLCRRVYHLLFGVGGATSDSGENTSAPGFNRENSDLTNPDVVRIYDVESANYTDSTHVSPESIRAGYAAYLASGRLLPWLNTPYSVKLPYTWTETVGDLLKVYQDVPDPGKVSLKEEGIKTYETYVPNSSELTLAIMDFWPFFLWDYLFGKQELRDFRIQTSVAMTPVNSRPYGDMSSDDFYSLNWFSKATLYLMGIKYFETKLSAEEFAKKFKADPVHFFLAMEQNQAFTQRIFSDAQGIDNLMKPLLTQQQYDLFVQRRNYLLTMWNLTQATRAQAHLLYRGLENRKTVKPLFGSLLSKEEVTAILSYLIFPTDGSTETLAQNVARIDLALNPEDQTNFINLVHNIFNLVYRPYLEKKFNRSRTEFVKHQYALSLTYHHIQQRLTAEELDFLKKVFPGMIDELIFGHFYALIYNRISLRHAESTGVYSVNMEKGNAAARLTSEILKKIQETRKLTTNALWSLRLFFIKEFEKLIQSDPAVDIQIKTTYNQLLRDKERESRELAAKRDADRAKAATKPASPASEVEGPKPEYQIAPAFSSLETSHKDVLDDVFRQSGGLKNLRSLMKFILSSHSNALDLFVAAVKRMDRIGARKILTDLLESIIEDSDSNAMDAQAWEAFDSLADMKRSTPTGEENIEAELIDDNEADTAGLAPLEIPWALKETEKFLASISLHPSVAKAYQKWKTHMQTYGREQIVKLKGYDDRLVRKGTARDSENYKSIARARLTMKYRIIYYFNLAEKYVEPIFIWDHQGNDIPNIPLEYKNKE